MAEKINLIGNEGFHIHAPVNSTTNGFMIKTDKAILDASTAAKTPSTLMKRDSNGQSKVSAPLDPEHIARKQDVDNLIITTGKIAPGAVTPNEMSAASLNAANHTYSGSVESASNVKQAIDLTKQRVDNIVAGAGASNTEILDARQPATGPAFPILRDRLNNTDAQLADIVTIINPTMTSQEIQNLLNNSGTFKFTKGDRAYLLDFLIGPVQPVCLDVQSNTKIEIEKGAVITIPPTNEGRYYIFQIDKKENVTIVGGEIIGDKLAHTGVTGEQGFGIGIRGSKNVTIDNVNIKQCWGDGIVIGRSYDNTVNYCDTVRIINTTCDNNRRQGISVTSCRNLWITDCILKNTNGTAPQAGIDLEPDQAYEALENINIINLKTENNSGAGILVAPFKLGSGASKCEFNTTITIDNHKSTSDFRGMYLVGSNDAVNKIDGQITIKNSYVHSPTEAGIRFENWLSSIFPYTIVENSVVKNVNGKNTNLGNTGRSGFVIYARSTYRDGEYGNVDFINCRTTDDRKVGVDYTTIKGFWFEGELATQTVKANVIDCYSDIFLAPGFVRWDKGKGVVSFSNKPVVSAATGVSIRDASGTMVTAPTSGSWSLPPANECVDREFIFFVSNAAAITVSPASGDSIIGYGYFANKNVVLSADADLLRVRSIGNNSWLVVEKQGNPHMASSSRPPRTYYQSAPPTAISSIVGDTVINITPTRVKNISHWVNITSGSSGSWQAYGTGYGTTAERPSLTAYDACYTYFDTTLGKMILWTGSAWLV